MSAGRLSQYRALTCRIKIHLGPPASRNELGKSNTIVLRVPDPFVLGKSVNPNGLAFIVIVDEIGKYNFTTLIFVQK
jgi:hypothetical protein